MMTASKQSQESIRFMTERKRRAVKQQRATNETKNE